MIDEKDILIPMRDGVRIAVRVYRPDGPDAVPALFAASPYRYDNDGLAATPIFLWRETGPIDWYVTQGYAYVHADVRGSGYSEGEFSYLGREEQLDLGELIEWTAAQPWCTGKVGTIGQSYYAKSQWFIGIQKPPHLTCMGLYDGQTDPYRAVAYSGGIESNFVPYWFAQSCRLVNKFPANGDHPREIEHDLTLDVQRHPFYDDYWKERSPSERLHEITTPLFSIGVWAKLDLHLFGNIIGYQRASGFKKLAITATATPMSSMTDFADPAFHERYLLPFYEHFLKGVDNGFEDRPNVEYDVRNTGVTRTFETWPPPDVRRETFYLSAAPSGSVTSLNDGSLATGAPAADGGTTSYAYPQPAWTFGVVALGPDGPDPARAVLTFTSPPLERDLEIAGSGKLFVHIATSGTDTDVIVKLSEQFGQSPADRAAGKNPRYTIVTKGWLRASHSFERHPLLDSDEMPYYLHERAIPLEPGRVYELVVPLQPMAYRFRAGNRIRLEIANADSPMTDSLFAHAYRPDKVGRDTLHHDAAYPSRLVLPVLDVD
jgi:putative CocE/NonD family hydrolase